MNISDDIEVYKFSKLMQILGEEKNSDVLYKYWVKSNKLKYLPMALGQTHASIASDEIQYVIALEILLEEFMRVLEEFIRDPYCLRDDKMMDMDMVMDADTLQQCDGLIVELEHLQSVSFDAGWVDFYEKLSKTVAEITAAIDRLLAVHNTGKKFHFVTNVKPEDFISGKNINLKRKIEKYFIIDKQVN